MQTPPSPAPPPDASSGPSSQERSRRPGHRRDRQLDEIASLLAETPPGAGPLPAPSSDRASGLIVEHLREFPDDGERIGRLLAEHTARPAADRD